MCCLKLLHSAFVCHCLIGLLCHCWSHKWLGQPGSLSGKLPLWDHLGLEINPPVILPCFVPSHLLFAQLNRSVTRTGQEALPQMPFQAPSEKAFSSCRSRVSLCKVAGTMKVLENWRSVIRISQGALAIIPKYLFTHPPTKYRFCQMHDNSWKHPEMQATSPYQSEANGNYRDFSRTIRKNKIYFLNIFSRKLMGLEQQAGCVEGREMDWVT